MHFNTFAAWSQSIVFALMHGSGCCYGHTPLDCRRVEIKSWNCVRASRLFSVPLPFAIVNNYLLFAFVVRALSKDSLATSCRIARSESIVKKEKNKERKITQCHLPMSRSFRGFQVNSNNDNYINFFLSREMKIIIYLHRVRAYINTHRQLHVPSGCSFYDSMHKCRHFRWPLLCMPFFIIGFPKKMERIYYSRKKIKVSLERDLLSKNERIERII